MRHPMTRQPMPRWMRSMLEAKGVISAQGLTATARIHTHRPCGIPTLAGFDDHVAALDAWCDLAQLSTLGEALALLDHRRTYQLWNDSHLRRRDRWNIPGHPPSERVPVFAEHRCHAPIPATWCLPPTPAEQPTAPADSEVPF